MYQQQESVFNSLFSEVTEAKSLVEQVALVCQGRGDMYRVCLGAVRRYVEEDLKDGLGKEPAQILSSRPMDDPLEIILYLTSVGIPSSIYDTVRSLRQARALRLASLQKKLPPIHLSLLWLLAIIELSSFPVLGAGTQSIGGYNILTVESVMFGILTFGVVVTLNVVGELYIGRGGAYNVDSVLSVMVKGLDEELEGRLAEVRGGSSVVADEDDVLLALGTAANSGEMPSPFGLMRQRYFESYDNGEDDSEECTLASLNCWLSYPFTNQLISLCLQNLQSTQIQQHNSRYVEEDLKDGLGKEPAQILSSRPMDDPLEIILYLTSVGIPSSIYDTVRSLRQARALRLASLQKKLPPIHLSLLWLLAIIELSSFPVLGAGTQSIGGYNILTVESVMFGILTFGVVVTLNVVGELYIGRGGAYNVDSVLSVMVKGLDEELEGRLAEVRGGSSVVADEDDVLLALGTAANSGEMPSPFGLMRQRYFESYDNGEDDSEEVNNI
ncbi:hypothetical protein ACHAWO_007105 [Cyclotella atomus]|uniref:Uncharacterized protein n=1 Tax=Cyclotella atomus TaxID=382360 RepID=A0ABD3QN83_9STRA